MKKKWIPLLMFTALCIVSLSACGDKKEKDVETMIPSLEVIQPTEADADLSGNGNSIVRETAEAEVIGDALEAKSVAELLAEEDMEASETQALETSTEALEVETSVDGDEGVTEVYIESEAIEPETESSTETEGYTEPETEAATETAAGTAEGTEAYIEPEASSAEDTETYSETVYDPNEVIVEVGEGYISDGDSDAYNAYLESISQEMLNDPNFQAAYEGKTIK